jgi:hypothetical protein
MADGDQRAAPRFDVEIVRIHQCSIDIEEHGLWPVGGYVRHIVRLRRGACRA